MEVAPFFVNFHHFLSIFTILYRFSRFTHFCRDLRTFSAKMAEMAKIAISATSHVFLHVCTVHERTLMYTHVHECTRVYILHECNKFFLTDRLHSERPDMDVRCISDSGSLYPFQDHTQFCFPQLLEYAASQVNSHTNKYEDQDKDIQRYTHFW